MSVIHRNSKIITLTPVVSTSPAYTSGDQVGGLLNISEALANDCGTALLQSLALIDKGKQKAALTIFFFDDAPTLANSDNGAFDLTDAECVLKAIGCVKIAGTDYQDTSSSSVATVLNCGLLLQGRGGKNAAAGSPLAAGQTKRDLWCVLMTTGTPTYVSTSDLSLKLGFEQH